MRPESSEVTYLGIGCYTVPEAARLLRAPALNIRRWLGGYTYRDHDSKTAMPPLWATQIPQIEEQLLLGFRDLIELRFVLAFLNAGLGLKTIRACIEYARLCVGDDRPFSTRRFQTDGKTIFLEAADRDDGLLDLRSKQYAIRQVIEQSFRDLDMEKNTVVRWRPYRGKGSIVVDPARSLGQPIAARSGVPTIAMADAVIAEGSHQAAARVFEVPISVVRDAVAFERSMLTA